MSPKEKRFVAEYLIDLNMAQAALRAGYSAKTAKEQGWRVFNKLEVQTAIQAAMAARSERTQIDADWLLRRLADKADADIAHIFDDDGNLRPIREWPKVFRQGLVVGMDIEEIYEGRGSERRHIGRLIKPRFADRTRIEELIGKHVGVRAFAVRVEHSGPGGGPIKTSAEPDLSKLSVSELEALEVILSKTSRDDSSPEP